MNKQLMTLSVLCMILLCSCGKGKTSSGVSFESISGNLSTTQDSTAPGPDSSDPISTGGNSSGTSTGTSTGSSTGTSTGTSTGPTSTGGTSVGTSTGTSTSTSTSTGGGTSSSTTPSDINGEIDGNDTLARVTGIDAISVVAGKYFDPLDGVQAISQNGLDITRFVNVKGHVDYGTPGTYQLTYFVDFNGTRSTYNRTVTVQNGTISRASYNPNYSNGTITLGSGSYLSGTGEADQTPAAPAFLEANLQGKPVPTNGWWTTMLNANYGGSNGIFTNPLRSTFTNDGVEITETSASFVQYWTDGDGALSTADFLVANKDLIAKATSLNETYTTKVIDYSDNAVKIAMRNSDAGADEMVVTMAQGSPYMFMETKGNKVEFILNPSTNQPYQFLSTSGSTITSGYTGDSMIVMLPRTHVGYKCEVPTTPNRTIVKEPIYKDKYYLINAPEGSTFEFARKKHASPNFLDCVTVTMASGNYLSVTPLNNVSEAAYYHQHGYAFVLDSTTTYNVDHQKSVVDTYYRDNYMNVNGVEEDPILALLPHQYKYSDATLASHTIASLRGLMKVIEGNSFATEQFFAGLLPTYTLPTDSGFSSSNAETYLAALDAGTNQTFEESKPDENRTGPYWDAKTFYPLAQGVVMADQMGSTTYKEKFLNKLETLIGDWLTYSGGEDTKYLYYNQTYKTMYYSDNNFNTATELSDHHFTHGYIIYAASVAAMYDTTFYNNYKDIISMLLKDYMNYDRSSSEYPYLRTFDTWAGHSWAHGFGFFSEGNNQESSGEALNSWLAGYMFGLQSGDTKLVDASIYGYVTELNAIKQYVFDYDQDIFSSEYLRGGNISAIIWGGKSTYATWFGMNANFVYGIHYLPIGEYVSGYAQNASERAALQRIYAKYLEMKVGFTDTWMANMWSVQALIDPNGALSNFDASKISNDDYPNDLMSCYWNLHAINDLGQRSDSYVISGNGLVAGDVHVNGSNVNVQLWNSSNSTQEVKITDRNGNVLATYQVEPHTFVRKTI